MKKLAVNLSLSLIVFQVSCIAQQSGGHSSNDSYIENLSSVRPVFESDPIDSGIVENNYTGQEQVAAATNTVNSKIDLVLDSLDKLNRLRKFVDGFTIQIYSGQNREEALSAKAKMVREVGDLDARIQYAQPKFRVTVGRYFSKIEAQKDLMRLRRYFSNAILIPEKILIK